MRIGTLALLFILCTACGGKKSTSSSTGSTNSTTSTGNNSTAPVTSTSNRPNNTARAAQILTLVNDHRATLNLNALTSYTYAVSQALDHTNYMIDDGPISHDNSFARSDYLKSTGATRVSENVGRGYRTAHKVLDGWLNSPKHKAAIEGSSTHTGIASVKNDNGIWYDTQIFINF